MDTCAINVWKRSVRWIEHQREVGPGEQDRLHAIARLQGVRECHELPAIVGGAAYFTGGGVVWLGLAAAGTVGGAALLFESYLLMGVLGRSLDSLEPSQVG